MVCYLNIQAGETKQLHTILITFISTVLSHHIFFDFIIIYIFLLLFKYVLHIYNIIVLVSMYANTDEL